MSVLLQKVFYLCSTAATTQPCEASSIQRDELVVRHSPISCEKSTSGNALRFSRTGLPFVVAGTYKDAVCFPSILRTRNEKIGTIEK